MKDLDTSMSLPQILQSVISRHMRLHGAVQQPSFVLPLSNQTVQPALFPDLPWEASADIEVIEMQQFDKLGSMIDRDIIPLAQTITVKFSYVPAPKAADSPLKHMTVYMDIDGISPPVILVVSEAGWAVKARLEAARLRGSEVPRMH